MSNQLATPNDQETKESMKKLMSKRQNELAVLHSKAEGKVILWRKEGQKPKILNADEVFIFPIGKFNKIKTW